MEIHAGTGNSDQLGPEPNQGKIFAQWVWWPCLWAKGGNLTGMSPEWQPQKLLAKGREPKEWKEGRKSPQSIPHTPFPSASGYLIVWGQLGFSNLLLFIPWRIPQAALNSSFPDGNHKFRLHGNIGTEISGHPESCTQYRLCQAAHPQRLCQGISVTHKIWERNSDFFFFLLKFLHFWRPEKLADGLYKVTSGHWEKEVAGSSDCPGFVTTWKLYFPWDEHISPSLLVVPTPTCSSRLLNDKRCRDKPQSWVGYLKLDFQPSLPLALHPGENKGVTASGKASHTQRPVCGSHIKCLGINFLQDVVFCMLATSQWCEEKV